MNYFVDKYNYFWDACVNYYHVDPIIFLVMYIVKSIIFWWLMTVILRRALRRQWDGLFFLITINAIVDVVPWVYVWIFGDNHPWWYQYMVYIVGGWGFIGIFLDIHRKRKKQEAEQLAGGGKAVKEIASEENRSDTNHKYESVDPKQSN